MLLRQAELSSAQLTTAAAAVGDITALTAHSAALVQRVRCIQTVSQRSNQTPATAHAKRCCCEHSMWCVSESVCRSLGVSLLELDVGREGELSGLVAELGVDFLLNDHVLERTSVNAGLLARRQLGLGKARDAFLEALVYHAVVHILHSLGCTQPAASVALAGLFATHAPSNKKSSSWRSTAAAQRQHNSSNAKVRTRSEFRGRRKGLNFFPPKKSRTRRR